MKIRTIYGLLIIKVSLDLICHCEDLDLTKLNELESQLGKEIDRRLDVRKRPKLTKKRKRTNKKKVNKKGKDSPGTKYPNQDEKYENIFKSNKNLILKPLHDLLNTKNSKNKKNKDKVIKPVEIDKIPLEKTVRDENELYNRNKTFKGFPNLKNELKLNTKSNRKGKDGSSILNYMLNLSPKKIASFLNFIDRSKEDTRSFTQISPKESKKVSKSQPELDLMSTLYETPLQKVKPKTKEESPTDPKPGDSIDNLLSPSPKNEEPLVKESQDPLGLKSKKDKEKETKQPEQREFSLEDALSDDKNEEEKQEKPISGKSKVEDINLSKKTHSKEKLVDDSTSLENEFKQHLGENGEFGANVRYYKGGEETKEKKKETTVKDLKKSEDHSEEWDNSGLAASLRYLGSGYDIVYGNPLGDPVVMMDQGYRNPVIKLNWDFVYLNKDGANMKEPKGSWVRPEFSCRQSETIDHINTVEDFKKELAVDAQASYSIPFFFSFSGSTGYKNFVKTNATNKVRTYITKTYCLRYVAGIVDYSSLETTEEFKKAVSKLPTYFDSEACTLELFKANEEDPMCMNSVNPWIQFIKMFGTHFTTIVHLGGKITHQVQINKSEVLSLQESGVNVDLAVKAAISPSFMDNLEAKVKNKNESVKRSESDAFRYQKQVLVIGGDRLVDSKDINSLNEWTKDLYKKPMPIKIRLESIKSLLSNDKMREAFEEALKFYSETYGVSPDEIYQKYGKLNGVAEPVKKGHQVVYSGKKSGSAVCPNNTVIIMGFTLTIIRKKNIIGKNEFTLHISYCPVGEEKCIVSNDSQESQSRIWAVCGDEPIPLLNQQTSIKLDEPATATCPSGYLIAYGFAFSIPKGNAALKTDSYACRSGTQACTHESTDKKATNVVWIACVEKGAPQLSDISNYMVSTSSRSCSSKTKQNEFKDNECPRNSRLIAGWSLDFQEEGGEDNNDIVKCSKYMGSCKISPGVENGNKCRSHYSWISCLNETPDKPKENNEDKYKNGNDKTNQY